MQQFIYATGAALAVCFVLAPFAREGDNAHAMAWEWVALCGLSAFLATALVVASGEDAATARDANPIAATTDAPRALPVRLSLAPRPR